MVNQLDFVFCFVSEFNGRQFFVNETVGQLGRMAALFISVSLLRHFVATRHSLVFLPTSLWTGEIPLRGDQPLRSLGEDLEVG